MTEKSSTPQPIPMSENTKNSGFQPSRRDFGRGVAGVTLLGFWAWNRQMSQAEAAAHAGDQLETTELVPAYVQITSDNHVIIVCPAAEMGQGVMTSLTALIAEEMEADWSRVRAAQSSAGEIYINPMKNLQATGRSMSVRGYFEMLREVGAGAKAMLLAAAAETWAVPADECIASKNFVEHVAGGRKASFAELAKRASELENVPPAPLKDRADYQIIGKPFPRKDLLEKVTGRAVFGIDASMPNMLTATIALAPTLEGKLTSFDEQAALAVEGVRFVVPTTQVESEGLAVVAETFWQAKKGLEAAAPIFSDGPHAALNSAEMFETMRRAVASDDRVAKDEGDVEAGLKAAKTSVSGVYEVPFLAHAPMEPMSCVAHVTDTGCQIIAPTQGPIRLRDEVATMLEMDVSQVDVQRTFLGGAFGRRWQPDFGRQAAEISKACGAPVKLIWSRETDMQHDYYRPQTVLAFEGALGDEGNLEALRIRTAGPSIVEWGKPNRLQGRPDPLGVSGLADSHYIVPNCRVSWAPVVSPVPVGVWRSVGHSQNGFFIESIIDELAVAAKTDPIAFRKSLLSPDKTRLVNVLDAVAELGQWRGPNGQEDRAQGVAVGEAYDSVCAYVIDVVVQEKALTIENVACVIDCGFAVNPDGVRAQMEGNVVFALSAAMYGEVTVENGAVVPSNFDTYQTLGLSEVPPISIKILENDDVIGGAGEPGLPPFAPALTNAIFAATGDRIRKLPLSSHGYYLV